MSATRLFFLPFASLIVSAALCADAPSFSSYPATVSFDMKGAAAVDLSSSPKARRYAAALRSAAAKGPNFAGAFTLVTWGCGVACQEIAVVDARNGRVIFPKAVKLNAYQAVTDSTKPIDYQLSSRMLVLAGAPNDGDETGLFYYEWTGEDLRPIAKQLRSWPR